MPSARFPQMYSSSQSTMMNNGGDLDGTGTINPATLNPAGAFAAPHQTPINRIPQSFYGAPSTHEYSTDSKPRVIDASPRGVKRSRSPEAYREGQVTNEDINQGTAEEPVRRKRGRPPKNKGAAVPPSPNLNSTPQQPPQPQQTQQSQQQPPQQQQQQQQQPQQQQQLPPPAPVQATNQAQQVETNAQPSTQVTVTPPKPVQPKPVVKALPTVRDHTTDQLTPEQDEYIPREFDEEGDKKVLPTGHLVNGREYRCRTFHVPNRGDKLFMLATECARVLGYRDSYLLFNKNRSLYKIIATQAEKDDLIAQELLPYSYRSRQIAIVTARSMFRQFGSRVIVNGRRVRDDYWESKARKQGFTEDDLAGEKRPGASKARQQQQAEQQAQQQQQQAQAQQPQPPAQQQQQHHEPAYTHESVIETPQPQMVQPGLGGPAPGGNMGPLPMIHLSQQHNPSETDKFRELLAVPRPRQEVTGPPYHDRVQPTPPQTLVEHVQSTADYNKQLTQQRNMRRDVYSGYYKPKSPPKPAQTQIGQPLPNPQATVPTPTMPQPQQHNPHPQQQQHAQLAPPHNAAHMSPQQLSSLHHQQQQQQQQQQQHQQQQQQQQPGPHTAIAQQSPVRMSQGIKPEQLHNPGGGYMSQQPYFHPPAPQPTHPQHAPQPHPQQSHHPLMHPQHQQGQPIYPAQPHYIQQPPPQSWKPNQAPPSQWWSGHQ